MSNTVMASIAITGMRPILWNAFTPAAIPLTKGEKTGVPGNDPEEWRRTVLVTDQRQLYLPRTAMFSCLREAARYTRQGRGTLQLKVSATLQVFEEHILIDRILPDSLTNDSTQPVYLDVQSVVNPATKAHNVRYRVAASPGWRAHCTLMWDCTIVSRSEMQAILHDAGRLVGLGNGRQIGLGRFTMTEFDVIGTAEVEFEPPNVIDHEV